jgi:dihydropyrimidinase
MSTALVKNGTIVTADRRYEADVYVEGGVITHIGRGLPMPADTVIDATGQLVMPGGIDAHTHLDMPFGDTASADDFESGTIAAACGGTTTIIDYATQHVGQGLYPALGEWMGRAEGRAVIDFGFHMTIRDLNDQAAADMTRMIRDAGVTSFKLFMAYPGRMMVDDETILRALVRARDGGGLVCMHAENGPVIEGLIREALSLGHTAPKYHALTRPPSTEGEATGRAIALAARAGAPIYIVHVSCSDALDQIRAAQANGQPAYGETCPQYLFLSADEYDREGFESARFVMSPPLRDRSHQEALWRGLQEHVLQVVATDHCPFRMDDPRHKPAGKSDFTKIPNGAPGIETRLLLLWDGGVRQGRIDAQRFVDLVAAGPARMFGLWPRKGTIAVGSDGDVVVWDPDRELILSARTLHMRVDYNPYEGHTVIGGPSVVMSRGDVIVDRGTVVGRAGRGQFVKRAASAPSVST